MTINGKRVVKKATEKLCKDGNAGVTCYQKNNKSRNAKYNYKAFKNWKKDTHTH